MRNSQIKIPVQRKPDGSGLKIMDTAICKAVVESMTPGVTYAMRLSKWKEHTISDPMRRYYFGVVAKMIAEHTGHPAEVIHDYLKRKILGVTVDKWGIEQVRSVFSDSSDMSVEEKSEFIDEVRRWASDFLELYIPDSERVEP
jgi:ribulose 1,5-bisphosphate synthetase/thiazole synthase